MNWPCFPTLCFSAYKVPAKIGKADHGASSLHSFGSHYTCQFGTDVRNCS
jgi:hypothetical protein